MRWKAEFYRPAKDSLLVSLPSVMLDVVPDGSLERVFGKITHPRGQVFPGVVVEVEGLFDTTDAAGNYDFHTSVSFIRDPAQNSVVLQLFFCEREPPMRIVKCH